MHKKHLPLLSLLVIVFILTSQTACETTECCVTPPLEECTCEENEPTFDPATGNNSAWGTAFLGSDTNTLFFPDGNANYWRYAFERQNDSMGLRIKGTFGEARYQSFNIYDENARSPIAVRKDASITSNCCHYNPYQPNNLNYEAQGLNYTLHIVPIDGANGGTVSEYASNLPNLVTYSKEVSSVSTFLRYYLPRIDAQGGRELPKLEAFNIHTGANMELPEAIAPIEVPSILIKNLTAPAFDAIVDSSVRFYNFNVGGFFPNLDVNYLAAPIIRQENEVVILRFKAPSFTRHASDNPNSQVRYWSISQGNESSRNFSTLADQDAIIAQDGFVNIVIGANEEDIITKAEGLNFMEWKVGEKMLLIYRNLVTNPDFAASLANVPVYDRALTPLEQSADVFIGDFAPQGIIISKEAYLNDFGGFPVSF